MGKAGRLSLTTRILVAMTAGIVAGLIVKYFLPASGAVQEYLIDGLFYVVGQIFINSLKMMVVPLVFVSLVCGTCSLGDAGRLGRLGIKSMGLYLATTAMAVSLALVIAMIAGPGRGTDLTPVSYVVSDAPPIKTLLVNLFPANPVQALAEGNMLQIIVFSLLLGSAVTFSGKAGKRISDIFNDLNTVVLKLVMILMAFAPYGVFCLIARLFASVGFETIKSLISYFVLVIVILLLHAFTVYPVFLKFFAGLNPVPFFKKVRPPVLVAFSTASSMAALPVTMETATKRLGVKNSVASFTLPLGATINMDGTAIMQGVATVFIAQAYNIDLSLSQYVTVVLIATLASIGTAAVPSAGLIMLAMVLQQVGLPVEGIALIIGVDRLLDMTRTAVNVTGDCMISCIIAKSEEEFEKPVYEGGPVDETVQL